jgi:hypothetical protein
MKSKNSKKNIAKHDGPGRPKYTPKFPRSNEWTFTQFMEVNGIETNSDSAKFGKGPNCTMLTLRKFMKRDMNILDKKGKIVRANPRSLVVNVRGVTAEPNSESGLGRRANLYALRSKGVTSHAPAKTVAPKATKAPRKTRTPASTSQTPTADALDKIHAALAAPDPAPAVTVPAVTITPEVTPAPAPVAETPAPAPEAAPAPVAETAPVTTTLVNS